MKETTHCDAVSVARLRDVNKESVWKILKGTKHSTDSELTMAVHKSFSL